MRIVVLGGGYVGQLVQLALPKAQLIDNRPTAPADHLDTRIGPQYLWKPIPNTTVTEFEVSTLVDSRLPTYHSILAYKKKVGKENDGGDWDSQFQPLMKGYQCALPRPRVMYGVDTAMIDLSQKTIITEAFHEIRYDLLVNTIPLPKFLELLTHGPEYSMSWFRFDPIYMTIENGFPMTDGMVLNYISDPADPVYRVTRTGVKEIRESLQTFGNARVIYPGKIHDTPYRHQLLVELAAKGVMNFGRFARWAPDELAHQTWDQISSWAELVKAME